MQIIECPKCASREFKFIGFEDTTAQLKCKTCGSEWWQNGKFISTTKLNKTPETGKYGIITNLCDSKCMNCGTAYSSGRYPDGCPTCSKMPLVKLLLHWYYAYHVKLITHPEAGADYSIKPFFLAVYRETSDVLSALRNAGTLTDEQCSETWKKANEISEKGNNKTGIQLAVEMVRLQKLKEKDGCEAGLHRIGEESVSIPKTERKLRELLFAEHSCAGKYGDDGERQCAECVIDFLRDPVDEIERKIQSRNFQRQMKWTEDQNNNGKGK